MSLRTLTAEIDAYGTVQGTVSVRFDRFDGDRNQYHYEVKDHEGVTLAEGDDLRSGSRADVNVPDMLATLLSFLEAGAESYRYEMAHGAGSSDNADMFPPACMAWAYGVSDELTMARAELGENI